MKAPGSSTSTSLRGSGCRASNGLKPSTRTPVRPPLAGVAWVSFWGGGRKVFVKSCAKATPTSSKLH